MIVKTKANQSFRETTKYVLEKVDAKIIGGNMIGTATNQLVKQFMMSRNLNPRVKAPCYHLMLSLPHRETLSDEQFASLGERHFATAIVLSRLTGDKAKLINPELRIQNSELNTLIDHFLEKEIHQYSFFIARHHDKQHQHIHIVASRINEIDGKAIKTWMQYPQSEWSARLLEKRFDLEQIPCSWESKNKALTRNQRDRLELMGLPQAEIIRRAIDSASSDRPSMPVLIQRLAQKEIMAEVSYQDNGAVKGIKYSICQEKDVRHQKRITISGTKLNRHKYSFPKLQSELGISYIPERDDPILKATLASARLSLEAPPIKNFPKESHPEEKQKQKLSSEQSLPIFSSLGTEVKDGYTVLAAAKYILAQKGLQTGDKRYFQGKFYRIEAMGTTLTISHKDRSELLFVATGAKDRESIFINQYKLNARDKELLLAYARYLEQHSKDKEEPTQVKRKVQEIE